MNFRALTIAGAFCALAFAPVASFAGSTTGSFVVDATVPPNCNVTAPGGFHFGTYDPLVANRSTDVVTDASFFMQCTLGTVPSITNSFNGSLSDGAGDLLNYTLVYQNNLTPPYGINKTLAVGFQGTIPAGQDVPVGSYSGTATIQVNF